MEEITLKETYNAMKRNILYIAGATVLAGLLMLIFGIFQSGNYEVRDTLMFGDPESMRKTDLVEYRGELAINQQLVENMKGILKNEALYAEVSADLDISVGEVEDSVNAQQLENSSLFEVTFSHPSKDMVKKIESSYLQNLKKILTSTYSSVKFYNLTENLNAEPFEKGLDLKLVVAAAFVAGMVAVCWALLREYRNPRLYGGEQIERRLQIPFLGMCSLHEEDTIKQEIILKSWEKKFKHPLVYLPQDVDLNDFHKTTEEKSKLQVQVLESVEKDQSAILKVADRDVILFVKKDKTALLDLSETVTALKNLDAKILGVFIDE